MIFLHPRNPKVKEGSCYDVLKHGVAQGFCLSVHTTRPLFLPSTHTFNSIHNGFTDEDAIPFFHAEDQRRALCPRYWIS